MSKENLQKSIVEIIWMARRYAVQNINNIKFLEDKYNEYSIKNDPIIDKFFISNPEIKYREAIFNEAYDVLVSNFKNWKEKKDSIEDIKPTFPYTQVNIEKVNLTLIQSVEIIIAFARRYANWAVVCIAGKQNIVQFVDLAKNDYDRLNEFLRFARKHTNHLSIDAHPSMKL